MVPLDFRVDILGRLRVEVEEAVERMGWGAMFEEASSWIEDEEEVVVSVEVVVSGEAMSSARLDLGIWYCGVLIMWRGTRLRLRLRLSSIEFGGEELSVCGCCSTILACEVE